MVPGFRGEVSKKRCHALAGRTRTSNPMYNLTHVSLYSPTLRWTLYTPSSGPGPHRRPRRCPPFSAWTFAWPLWPDGSRRAVACRMGTASLVSPEELSLSLVLTVAGASTDNTSTLPQPSLRAFFRVSSTTRPQVDICTATAYGVRLNLWRLQRQRVMKNLFLPDLGGCHEW